MPEGVQTAISELGDSRVRVQVTVPSAEVEAQVQRKAAALGRELKLPGFRKGKVPPQLVIARLGRESVLDQTVRDALGTWYAAAIEDSGIVPVGDPELDLADLPEQGSDLAFTIEIGVLPRAELGQYEGLEVPRREPHADPQAIEAEIEGLRERLAKLETADRPAGDGDFVVIDYVGSLSEPGEDGAAVLTPFAGGEGRDQLVELGGGNLIPGFEEGLRGAAAGETRTLELTFPADYGATELAGREASFEVTVKEVKTKLLPEVDDDLAIDAGFDDVQALRGDLEAKLLEADEARVEAEFRQAALDAAVAAARVAVTPELATARAKEMWERTVHQLAHRGISRDMYLRASGRQESEILAELEPDAEQGLAREAVITAIVAAAEISPSDEEILQALAPTAEREGVPVQTLRDDVAGAGRLDDVREDLAARQAIDLVARTAKPIPVAQAQARDALWTPEKEEVTGAEPAPAGAGQLWTPGS